VKAIWALLFLTFFSFGWTQTTTRILFILDASNSMNLDWNNQTRMAAAKEVLTKSVESLRGVPNLELALRVYGHQSNVTNTYQDCQDTKLEVPFGPANIDPIKTKIKGLQAKGATPIARSLEA
jgi:Ca-activated chloride channel family protein